MKFQYNSYSIISLDEPVYTCSDEDVSVDKPVTIALTTRGREKKNSNKISCFMLLCILAQSCSDEDADIFVDKPIQKRERGNCNKRFILYNLCVYRFICSQ